MLDPAPRTFRIRHYECDAYGHLNNTAYLRYLEEMELAAGLRGEALRRMEMTYVRPLGFGDAVTVAATTPGRAEGLVLRSYTFTEDATGAGVARATAAWEPGEPDLALPEVPPPGPLPAPPPAPDRVYRHDVVVGWRDVDDSEAMSPGTLAAVAEDAGVALCAAFGWPMERCTEAGFSMVLRRHEIEYGRLPRLGDRLTVSTYASDLARASAVRHYLIDHQDGTAAARFRSHYVWVDPATMRPIRVPEGFLGDFAANFAG